MKLTGDFRRLHRMSSESLVRAAESDDGPEVMYALDQATHFETQALQHVVTNRQQALAMGLLHAVDLMRAVAATEFRTPD